MSRDCVCDFYFHPSDFHFRTSAGASGLVPNCTCMSLHGCPCPPICFSSSEINNRDNHDSNPTTFLQVVSLNYLNICCLVLDRVDILFTGVFQVSYLARDWLRKNFSGGWTFISAKLPFGRYPLAVNTNEVCAIYQWLTSFILQNPNPASPKLIMIC